MKKKKIKLRYPGYYTIREATALFGPTHNLAEGFWRGLYYRGIFDGDCRKAGGRVILLLAGKVEQIAQMNEIQRSRLIIGNPYRICTDEVVKLLDIANSTIWHWLKKGAFPKPFVGESWGRRWWDIRKVVRFANENKFYINLDLLNRLCEENQLDKKKISKLSKQGKKTATNVQRLQ